MARKMPVQKPGKSEQVVRTPPEFLRSVKLFLGFKHFTIDLAASDDNAVCSNWITKEQDALTLPWLHPGWGWLNPEYGHIASWVYKAHRAKQGYGTQTVVLIPASVGSNWWRDYVHQKAMVLFLNGRITFNDKHGDPICSPKTGKPTPYPKDLALLIYSPDWAPGYDVWNWREE